MTVRVLDDGRAIERRDHHANLVANVTVYRRIQLVAGLTQPGHRP